MKPVTAGVKCVQSAQAVALGSLLPSHIAPQDHHSYASASPFNTFCCHLEPKDDPPGPAWTCSIMVQSAAVWGAHADTALRSSVLWFKMLWSLSCHINCKYRCTQCVAICGTPERISSHPKVPRYPH